MNNTQNKRKSIFKKILGFFETILTILVILICLIIVIQRVSNNEKSLLGYRLFKIESGSMVPEYQINDVLLVKEVDVNKIKIEDDLVYIGVEGQTQGKVITHRVVDIKNNENKLEFYTQGLANDTIDPVVYEEQILGVVQTKVYTLTFITNALSNIYTLYFIIILPIILHLFFSELHSSERKERYIEQRKKEEQHEYEKQVKKESKANIVKAKQQSMVNVNGKSKKQKKNKKS